MGVTIYACKVKKRVGELCNGKEWDNLLDEYSENGKYDLLEIKDEKLSEPFGVGVFTYESCGKSISMSYGTNWDFREYLEWLEEENENYNCFYNTLNAHSIDNSIPYPIAEEMLKEFEGNKELFEKHANERFGEDFGEFMVNIYNGYIKILRECIEVKGVVRYH